MIVSDLACCSSTDADFVCDAADNKCADLPAANVNLIPCCSGANPTVPGISTDAPVEPTASSTMESSMSTDMSSSETSTETVVTDGNGVTVTEGTTDSAIIGGVEANWAFSPSPKNTITAKGNNGEIETSYYTENKGGEERIYVTMKLTDK